jgi:hypothetical protein
MKRTFIGVLFLRMEEKLMKDDESMKEVCSEISAIKTLGNFSYKIIDSPRVELEIKNNVISVINLFYRIRLTDVNHGTKNVFNDMIFEVKEEFYESDCP